MLQKFIAFCFLISLSSQSYAEEKILLLADPKVLAVPIIENNEPIVDLKDQNIIAVGPSPEIPNNTDYTKMRKNVYDNLVAAQNMLPDGMKLCLYEGYRSLELQQTLFSRYYEKMKQAHPTYNHEQLFMETLKLVSPVVNLDGSKNIPPHSTGAAVDVYLIDNAGNILDMGILAKDWMQDLDGSLSKTNSIIVSKEAQKNRQIMSDVLTKVGFVNFPAEYWHWSYGDKYWAYNKGEKNAFYGTIK